MVKIVSFTLIRRQNLLVCLAKPCVGMGTSENYADGYNTLLF